MLNLWKTGTFKKGKKHGRAQRSSYTQGSCDLMIQSSGAYIENDSIAEIICYMMR